MTRPCLRRHDNIVPCWFATTGQVIQLVCRVLVSILFHICVVFPQVMKTCEALRSEGFHSVTTIEFRLRNINYVEMQLDVPDFGSNPPAAAPAAVPAPAPAASAPAPLSAPQEPLPSADTKSERINSGIAEAAGVTALEGPVGAENGDEDQNVSGGVGTRSMAGPQDASGAVEQDGNEAKAIDKGTAGGGKSQATRDDGGDNKTATDGVTAITSGDSWCPTANGKAANPAASSESNPDSNINSNNINNKRPRDEASAIGARVNSATGSDGGGLDAGRARNERLQPKAALRAAEAVAGKGGARNPTKLVCAQPFPLMRGHTAFLTFATAPVARKLGTAKVAAAEISTAEAEAASAETGTDGSVGQHTSVAGDATGELRHAGDGPSDGGTDDGGEKGGSAMDVCDEDGVGDKGKGKSKGTAKGVGPTGSGGEERSDMPAAVSDRDDSTVAER